MARAAVFSRVMLKIDSLSNIVAKRAVCIRVKILYLRLKYSVLIYTCSKKFGRRSYVLFSSGRVLFEKFREQQRNKIPRAGSSQTQGDHSGSGRWTIILYRRHNTVGVRGKDL